MNKFQKWTIEIAIDNSWVADGFNITDENVHDVMRRLIKHAYGHEIKAKVLKAPRGNIIRKLQGG